MIQGANIAASLELKASYVYFLGLRTEGSLALKAFPRWMSRFASHCTVKPIDMERSSSTHEYIMFVRHVRNDPLCLGAQITSHKVDIFNTASREFDYRSEDVEVLEEVGGIVSRAGQLAAISPDALALQTELSLVVGRDPRSVIILGGGGAGRSIALSAARMTNVQSITITELREDRLSSLHELKERVALEESCSLLTVFPGTANDDLVSSASAGAVIVNATGLGKDVPGSPVADGTRFPKHGIAWDLNYRGQLTFLEQARKQVADGLAVRDGFSFFVRNWTCFLECALDRRLPTSDWPALEHDTQEARAAMSLSAEVE